MKGPMLEEDDMGAVLSLIVDKPEKVECRRCRYGAKRCLCRPLDRKILENGKIARPFFMKRRRHHDNPRPFAAVSKGGHQCDAECDEGLAHSYFVREHNPGLIP